MEISRSEKKDLKTRAEEIGNSIRQILFDEWDPIGVRDSAPRDEYDGHTGGVYTLLANGADLKTIADHLRRIETARIGCTTRDEHRTRVAELLRSIDVSLPNR